MLLPTELSSLPMGHHKALVSKVHACLKKRPRAARDNGRRVCTTEVEHPSSPPHPLCPASPSPYSTMVGISGAL